MTRVPAKLAAEVADVDALLGIAQCFNRSEYFSDEEQVSCIKS